ncbi:hypothetical protein KP509_38G062800 [Ceratopteris richardii]|uniref:trans-cinnamate 4-monooxygenase n=1 Tax=Ceratopteris richardii TaxID=49495 RepID=A0A8T2Q5H4_CERRI|nr:hypothetical protein KP509_38G062800 [Ceratopteris richardii]
MECCMLRSFPSFFATISLETVLFAILAVILLEIAISHVFKPKLRLPPGPLALPIFGNWLQVGDDLNHENLSQLAKKFGEIFLLRMGQRNLVIVSSPELAKGVLHTQGVEFGSRTRNVVFDIFTGKGQDMVFTVYGDHWRKMRRIMTVPFFTNKVVQQNRVYWEQEIDLARQDLKSRPAAATTGVVICQRSQMLMYNNMYRMMFNRRFERDDDPLFKVKEERLNLFNKYFMEEHKKLIKQKPPCNEEKCALDHMLDAQKNGEITEENILYIVENINVAAIETTLWTIEWGLAELVNNLDIQKKVREEMNTVLGKGVPITEPDVSRLPYLHAVLKETMRLHMPIPLLVPHMNLLQSKLAGYDIPAESSLLKSIQSFLQPAHFIF